MNHLYVVAAIIHDSQNCIFTTQRGYGDWKDYREFPVEKVELRESPKETAQWLAKDELDSVRWLPADLEVL